jgi:peptidyl-tRNA hydrolase
MADENLNGDEGLSPMPGEFEVSLTPDKENELRIWCAVRTDLDIPIGKFGTQTGHAFVAALWAAPEEIAREYMSEAGQAKIVVRVKNEFQLLKAYEACKAAGLTAVLVRDAGRTVFPEPTYTTMAVGPCRMADLPKSVGRLQLY